MTLIKVSLIGVERMQVHVDNWGDNEKEGRGGYIWTNVIHRFCCEEDQRNAIVSAQKHFFLILKMPGHYQIQLLRTPRT